jgi:hypothetical protein
VRGLLHVLIFADFAGAAVLLAIGIRLEFLKMSELPERRSFPSLRRPLPSELSEAYHAYQRRFMQCMFAFVVVIAFGAVLSWISNSLGT